MTCQFESCKRKQEAKGFCSTHYYRLYKYGDPSIKHKPGLPPGDQLANVLKRVVKEYNEVGCWAWMGATKKYGYGVITISKPKRKTERVYRFLYEQLVGPIINGFELDHFMYPQDGCIGPNCCNPSHLEPKSHKENSLRSSSPPAINAKKTHCINGHEFTIENTYTRKNRVGRECKVCIKNRGKNDL